MNVPIDDSTNAYYRSMARNMAPAIFDLFYQFCKSHGDLNPYRAYLIGKFLSSDSAVLSKPENQSMVLKHFDDTAATENAADTMQSGEVAQHKEEYEFVQTILPNLAGTLQEEADHLMVNLTDMYLVVTLVKPTEGATYLRVQCKCYKKKGWNKLFIDGKI